MPEACKPQSCEADRKEMIAGNIAPNEECCTPEPFPENGTMCGENPPENVGGAVACNPNDRSDTQLCTWLKGGYNDPQAESIIINGAIAHEKIHDQDANYSCKTVGDEHYLGGNEDHPAKPYGEMMGSIEEMKYLEKNIQTCCTQSCVDDIKKRHRGMIGYCKTNAYEYYDLTKETPLSELTRMCNRTISY